MPRLLKMDHREKYYFQQDGDTPHTAISVQSWMKSKFCQKFITKEPRSTELNPCDFFYGAI